MNLKIATVICATIILIGILFWPTLYRYDTITIYNNTLPVRINRLTGFTERYTPQGGWIPGEGQKKGKSLPEEEQAKVKVTQGKKIDENDIGSHNQIDNLVRDLKSNDFHVKIYNGSNWTVTDIVFEFKTNDGRTIKLIGSSIVHPLTTGSMTIKTTGEENTSTYEIIDIKGYKD